MTHDDDARVSNPSANQTFGEVGSWPDGPTGGRPRSACLVITRDDGDPIGGSQRGRQPHGD